MTNKPHHTVNLTAGQFETQVEGILRRSGVGLTDFNVQRLEKILASDGVYEIDVTARFKALGDVLVLIECKHHRNPIKREVVQVLYDKLRAVGAQKGMIFSTVKFQRGAIQFAQAHGIALVMVADGNTMYITRALRGSLVESTDIPLTVAWVVNLNASGEPALRLLWDNCAPLLQVFEQIRLR